MKSAEEIMEILEAFDLTGSCRDAAVLAGCSHHTVAQYVRARAEGRLTPRRADQRPMLIDAFLPKLEEWVEHSRGRIRADVVHDKLAALGYVGSERTTRRAVAEVKSVYRSGRRRVHRPWIPEPGMWFQYDYGDGPRRGWCWYAVVLRVAGVVPVPGGAGVAGQDAAVGDGRDRSGAAHLRWGAHLRVDRLCGAPHNRSSVPGGVMCPTGRKRHWRFGVGLSSGT